MTSGSESVTRQPTVEVGSASVPATTEPEIAIGRCIGRYVVLDEVGSGGMGRVFRAYDPKLRREVAVKRLRVGAGSAATAQARMLREAQAMARLAHPNVVPVYDVDAEGGSLFIAMEYVDGATLQEWLAARSRAWREVLDVFLQAGEGLLAAHREGIVHRDFKPANVIVGRDGRTRVMDFGLARSLDAMPSSAAGDDAVDAPLAEVSTDDEALASAALTEHGTVMGTPAYMAPEQHAGGSTDTRTDQYAFSIALWEALHGERPFRADGLERLADAKRGPLPRPPSGTPVPASVHAAIARGLSVDPDARFADMGAMLAALQGSLVRRGPWPLLGVAAVAFGALGLSLAGAEDPPCRQGDAEVEEVWSEAARLEIREGLQASGVGFAESTALRVDATLDAYASELAAMQRDACEATKVRHEQSDEALDLRMACLRSRREELRTVVSIVTQADGAVAEKAVEVATGLTPIESCRDPNVLRSRVPLPADPATATAVDEVREALARARIARGAGRVTEAIFGTESALATARELGYEPLVAEAELARALALWSDGKDAEARPHAEHALKSALRLSLRHLAAEAAIAIAGLTNSQQGRAADAAWLAKVGLALAEGDGTDPALTAEAMLRVGDLHAQEERLLDAEPYFRDAVHHVETHLGPEHPELVSVLTSWVSLLDALGRDAEAAAAIDRARALAEKVFGPDHPGTAAVIRRQAWRAMMTGEYARAEAGFREARAIYEAALGPEHPSTISILGTMAGALAEQGKLDEAAAGILEAEGRLGTRVADDHPMRASLSHNLASILAMQGDHAGAVERYRHAIEIRRRLGMKNDLAAALAKQAVSLVELQRLDEAQAALEEAEQLDIEAHAADGNRSAIPALELGKLARRRGDSKAAREHLETAAIFGKNGAPRHRAEIALLLGQTLWELDLERPRGRALVQQALEIAEAGEGEAAPELAAGARAWLDAHRDPQAAPSSIATAQR